MARPGRLATASLALALVVAVADIAVLLSRTARQRPNDVPTAAPSAVSSPRVTALDDQLREVAELVAEIRGLDFDEIPEPTYLSPEELSQRAALLLEDYTEEDAAEDARILAAVGAVPPDIDLRGALEEALAEQVAGFYDPRTSELVVATSVREGPLPPIDKITLAHELQHALADQVLGLPDDDPEEGREDAALARQALVEGDATYTMLLFVERGLTPAEIAGLAADADDLAGRSEVLDALPHYLRRSLTFAYEEGLSFVVDIERRAGWERVNEAYLEPPTTTLQILRPELFLSGEGGGEDPSDPADPGGTWEHQALLAMGAADLLFLFEAPGDDPSRALDDAAALAGAWRGGELALWTDGGRTAVGIAMVGEASLCDGMDRWYTAAFGSADRTAEGGSVRFDGAAQDAVLRCEGGEIRLGIAPDLQTAEAITD